MILLDTHAWIWWVDGSDQLSATALQAIEDAAIRDRVLISSISAWEVALLVKRGRLDLGLPARRWIARTERLDFVELTSITSGIAVRSAELPEHHRDPADRLILASALELDVPVVSRDERFGAYDGVDVVW